MLQRKQPDPSDAGRSFDLLPAIDLRAGRVVRLARGDFDRETVYGSDPAAVARRFAEAGARWIHVVDLDGAKEGSRRQLEAVASVVQAAGANVRCEVAGGLRDEAAVAEALAAGAARAVVGTAALRDPAFAGRLVRRFGADRVAVALDIRDGFAVGEGWVPGAAGASAEETMRRLAELGVRTFIVTAIERDGMLAGPDLGLLARLVAQTAADVIASGGVSSAEDVESVRRIGCRGAIVGRALYEGRMDLAAVLRDVGTGSGRS